jgi:hypothetical protein
MSKDAARCVWRWRRLAADCVVGALALCATSVVHPSHCVPIRNDERMRPRTQALLGLLLRPVSLPWLTVSRAILAWWRRVQLLKSFRRRDGRQHDHQNSGETHFDFTSAGLASGAFRNDRVNASSPSAHSRAIALCLNLSSWDSEFGVFSAMHASCTGYM